ncbi:MAG: 4-hydroxythreonine-4-phosphate dehydrogenase PdxA [Chlamydiae bacterium]|nr:4-hydroxythreonine-4-phosphate dehydrogenase PdxA [Chlamydiota bacterium]MBI3265712.1 4-hydroxythreonine-4-phosphate dehydrogenase PdxA [Chlamydiota bacterium]
MKPIIAITLGDVAGIGPEVVAKALARDEIWKVCQPWVYGPPGVLEHTSKFLEKSLREIFFGKSIKGKILIRPVGKISLDLVGSGQMSQEVAKAALDAVHAAARDALEGKVQALVTAPLHKKNVRQVNPQFLGHTEFLADLTQTRSVVMMMASPRLKVALVTTHVPLKEVSKNVTREKIFNVISIFHEALESAGLKKPKIGVCALNPHGGEDGGEEEKKKIGPAVRLAQKKGMNVEGPFSADTLFYKAWQGKYDGVVSMYHDQGLAPLKMMAFDEAVNVTLGLPFVRTSPDHGTAYPIAGRGIASPESMVSAIQMAARLVKREIRQIYRSVH